MSQKGRQSENLLITDMKSQQIQMTNTCNSKTKKKKNAHRSAEKREKLKRNPEALKLRKEKDARRMQEYRKRARTKEEMENIRKLARERQKRHRQKKKLQEVLASAKTNVEDKKLTSQASDVSMGSRSNKSETSMMLSEITSAVSVFDKVMDNFDSLTMANGKQTALEKRLDQLLDRLCFLENKFDDMAANLISSSIKQNKINDSFQNHLTTFATEQESIQKLLIIAGKQDNYPDLQTTKARTDELSRKIELLEIGKMELSKHTDTFSQAIKVFSAQNEIIQTEVKANLLETETNMMKIQMNSDKVSATIKVLENELKELTDKLSTVEIKQSSDKNTISKFMTELETHMSKSVVGTSAYTELPASCLPHTTITDYKVRCNEGNNFDPLSGKFTASVDGLYVACVSVFLYEIGVLGVNVLCNSGAHPGYTGQHIVCGVRTEERRTQCSELGVVKMKAGDPLCTQLYHTDNKQTRKSVDFSCFRIG